MAQRAKHREVSAGQLSDKDLIALEEKDELHLESVEECDGKESDYSYKWNEIVWRNVILLSLLHIAALYAWILFMVDHSIKWQTSVDTFVFGLFSSSLGITAGAHRLWSHRAYKARWPLRLINTFSSIFDFIFNNFFIIH